MLSVLFRAIRVVFCDPLVSHHLFNITTVHRESFGQINHSPKQRTKQHPIVIGVIPVKFNRRLRFPPIFLASLEKFSVRLGIKFTKLSWVNELQNSLGYSFV